MSPLVDIKHGDDEPGPGSQSSLRSANEARVLESLRLGGELTQAELSRRTALAPSTVSNIVRDLAEAGVVAVQDEHGGRRGRLVKLEADGRLLLGVEFGQSHLAVALAGLSRQVIAETTVPMPLGHDHVTGLARAVSLVSHLLERSGLDRKRVVAGGMALPAPIDLAGRVVGSRSVLPGWAEIDLVEAAERAFGVPMQVDNDANAGALGEFAWGAGRGHDNFAYLKLAHGIGAGLILNGRLFRGENGVSGEIGHTTVDERGVFCRCGNRGCLETIATTPRLLGMLTPTHPRLSSIADVVAAARAGDAGCARALGDTGRAVGIAVANLCNIVNPGLIVVGGEVSLAGDLIIEPMRAIVVRYGVPSAVAGLTITTSELGRASQLRGAIELAAVEAEPRILAASRA